MKYFVFQFFLDVMPYGDPIVEMGRDERHALERALEISDDVISSAYRGENGRKVFHVVIETFPCRPSTHCKN